MNGTGRKSFATQFKFGLLIHNELIIYFRIHIYSGTALCVKRTGGEKIIIVKLDAKLFQFSLIILKNEHITM